MVLIADQHNANIPALSNQVAEDIPDIKENLEFHKDAFERLFETFSVTDNSASKINSATGFTDGTYNYEFPTNPAIAASSVIMLGNSSTIAWFYLNAAPPGWKVSTVGQGTVIAVSDTAGKSAGTTTSTSSNNLVDSGADFVTDSVAAGDVVYNTTDDTVTTVASVTDLNTLALDDDYFTGSEGYIVGQPYVEAGGRQSANGSWTPINESHVHKWYDYEASATHQSHNSAGAETNLTVASTSNVGLSALGTAINKLSADFYTDSKTITVTTWRPTASIGKLFQLDTA